MFTESIRPDLCSSAPHMPHCSEGPKPSPLTARLGKDSHENQVSPPSSIIWKTMKSSRCFDGAETWLPPTRNRNQSWDLSSSSGDGKKEKGKMRLRERGLLPRAPHQKSQNRPPDCTIQKARFPWLPSLKWPPWHLQEPHAHLGIWQWQRDRTSSAQLCEF